MIRQQVPIPCIQEVRSLAFNLPLRLHLLLSILSPWLYECSFPP